MKHFKNIIFVLMLTLLMPLFTLTAFAADSYGFNVATVPETAQPGQQVDVYISLSGYTEQAAVQEGIRGLQVDIAGVGDANVVGYTSAITDATAISNKATYNTDKNLIRLLYVNEDGTLRAPCENVLKVSFVLSSELTAAGSITLPVTVKIQTIRQPITKTGEVKIYYSPDGSDQVAAVGSAAYETLSEAMAAAQEGDTVKLLKDTQENILQVIEGVALDLNGNKLTASYAMCYGDIVDYSDSNSGVLNVPAKRFLIQHTNEQLPVKTAEGYRFYEINKFNEAILYSDSDSTLTENGIKFVFQPFIESAAHQAVLDDDSGVSIEVMLRWPRTDGTMSTQSFAYNAEKVKGYLDSYDETSGKYGQMFTLTLKNARNYQDLTCKVRVISDTGVEFMSTGGTIEPVE